MPRLLEYKGGGAISYTSLVVDPYSFLFLGGAIQYNTSYGCGTQPFIELVRPEGMQIYLKVIYSQDLCSVVAISARDSSNHAAVLMSGPSFNYIATILYTQDFGGYYSFKRVPASSTALNSRSIAYQSDGYIAMASLANSRWELLSISYINTEVKQSFAQPSVGSAAAISVLLDKPNNMTLVMGIYNNNYTITLLSGAQSQRSLIQNIETQSNIIKPENSLKVTEFAFQGNDPDYYSIATGYSNQIQNQDYVSLLALQKSNFALTGFQKHYKMTFKVFTIEVVEGSNMIILGQKLSPGGIVVAKLFYGNDTLLYYTLNSVRSNSYTSATFGKLTSFSNFYSLDGYIVGYANNMLSNYGSTQQNGFALSLKSDFDQCNSKQALVTYIPLQLDLPIVNIVSMNLTINNPMNMSEYSLQARNEYFSNFTVRFPCEVNSNVDSYTNIGELQNLTYYFGTYVPDTIYLETGLNINCNINNMQFTQRAFDTALDQFVSLVPPNSEPQIYISNQQNILLGSYQVTLFYQLPSGKVFYKNYTLIIEPVTQSPCYNLTFNQQPYISDNIVPNTTLPFSVQILPVSNDRESICQTRYSSSIYIYDVDGIKQDINRYNITIVSNQSDSGNHNGTINIRRTYFTGKSNSTLVFTFYFYVVDFCASATIYDFLIEDVHHDIYSGMSDQVDLSRWVHSLDNHTNCNKLTFQLLSSTGSYIASNTYGIVNSPFTIFTPRNSSTLVGQTINLKVRANLVIQGKVITFKDTPLNLYFHGECNTAKIFPVSTFEFSNYSIGSDEVYYVYQETTYDKQYCGEIEESVIIDGLATLPSFVSQPIDYDLRNIAIQTSSYFDEGLHNITIIGKLPNNRTGNITIPLQIVNPCRHFDYINPITEIVANYFSNPLLIYQLPYFQDSQGQILPEICTDSQTIEFISPLIYIFYEYDQTSREFSISQDSYGTFDCDSEDNLEIQMIINAYPHSINATSNLKIRYECDCSNIQIDPIQNYSFTYYLGDLNQALQFVPFEKNNSVCHYDSFSYSIVEQFQPSLTIYQDNYEIVFPYSTDLSLLGNYRIHLRGEINYNFTEYSEITNIDLKVLQGCNLPNLTSKPNLSYSQYKYKVGDPELIITSTKWNLSQSYCGRYDNYSLVLMNSTYSTIDYRIASYNQTHGNISISSQDKSLRDLFYFKFSAILSSTLENVEDIFRVEITNCSTKSIQPNAQKTIYTYTLGDQQQIISVLPFIQNEDCGFKPSYRMTVTSNAKQSSFIEFKQELNSITYETSSLDSIGVFSITITGQVLNDLNQKLENSITFKLTVSAPKRNPPTFLTAPCSMSMSQKSTYDYLFPSLSLSAEQKAVIYVSGIPSFAKYDEIQLRMYLEPDERDVGNYTVSLTLKDSADQTLKSSYSFTIEVYGGEEVVDDSSIMNSTAGEYLQMNQNEYSLGGIRIPIKKLQGKMFSYISEVSQYGEVTIRFSDKLLKLEDTQPLVNFNALQFYLQKYKGKTTLLNSQKLSNQRNLEQVNKSNETDSEKEVWKVTEFDDKKIKVKINFPDPKDISTQTTYDRLNVKFSNRFFFVNDEMTKTVENNAAVSTSIPPQLPDDGKFLALKLSAATKALADMASAASSAISGAISTNIFLSVILGLSLKKLWMLIQTLQVIVHLPLLQISLPSNAIMAFQTIIDISNMNIIPKETVNTILSLIIPQSSSDDSESSQTNQNFSQMDIF